MAEYDNKCIGIDYEAQCKTLSDENMKLKEEIAYLRNMENEFARMRAQLDIVYMIFGGRNNG